MIPDNKQLDTEVQPKSRRRTFTATYKHCILSEADQCRRGELGALLRREVRFVRSTQVVCSPVRSSVVSSP